jgi:Zn-dependent M32 family carboxypeptidase
MNQVFNQAQRMMEMWTDMATRMATAVMSVTPDAGTPQMAREVRSAVLGALSENAEQFMRSPQFLEFAKQSLDSNIQLREQLNDFLTKIHHELQGVARQDVDNVLAAIHQMERRLLDRLDTLEARIQHLEENSASPADSERTEKGKPGAKQKKPRS